MNFAVQEDHSVKLKENENIGSYQRAEKAVEHKSVGDNKRCWYVWTYPQGFEKKTGNWKSEVESRLYWLQHCWDQLEYAEIWEDLLSLEKKTILQGCENLTKSKMVFLSF